MQVSTPQRNVRRHSLLNNSVISSSLRKSIVPSTSNPALGPADDEEERSSRRSFVAIQKRLTNISSSTTLSPLVDNSGIIEEHQIQDHLRICAKLYTENRISAKNAWQLHIIDVMRKIAMTDNNNVLQMAGTSLDIGAKVYGLRVDDVHAKGLQLAHTMAKSNEKPSQEEQNDDIDPNDLTSHAERRRAVRKKGKKLCRDKRNTIDKEGKSLFASIKKVETSVFATKESIDVGAIDNLFTNKILTNPATHQFMLMSNVKYWELKPDQILENADKLLDGIEFPNISPTASLCARFKDFEIGAWDPEEEERMLGTIGTVPEPVLDDDGFPVPELDGSIHDVFENDQHDDPVSDTEEQPEVFEAQIQGNIANIVDAIPEENRIETDYGYNTLVRTTTGKYIDKLWAGPSHWKVKFNRRSTARFSGSVQQVVKQIRKTKVPQQIDFSKSAPDLDNIYGKYVSKRAPPTSTFVKVTLPVPEVEISYERFHKLTDNILLKPEVLRPRGNKNKPASNNDNLELPAYNYENPNDSFYCSQHTNEDANDGPAEHSYEEEAPPAAQQQFMQENLVDAPEMVSSTHIQYALHAKKMDMKKLKGAVWKCLQGGQNDDTPIKPVAFSSVYQELPQLLSTDMRKELSCPLAFVALLHLCNENNLKLLQKGPKDFIISKAVES